MNCLHGSVITKWLKIVFLLNRWNLCFEITLVTCTEMPSSCISQRCCLPTGLRPHGPQGFGPLVSALFPAMSGPRPSGASAPAAPQNPRGPLIRHRHPGLPPKDSDSVALPWGQTHLFSKLQRWLFFGHICNVLLRMTPMGSHRSHLS